MIVVCDTTPINYLLQIDLIDLIPRLWGKAFLPPVVHGELLDRSAPQVVRAWASDLPEWIAVEHPGVIDAPALLKLHSGESQALALAERLNADLLVTDDKKARNTAHARGIPTATTLLILDSAANRGWIEFESAITKLIRTNFRVDPETVAELVAKHS
jgi:predicted nucleic acid-binding protein